MIDQRTTGRAIRHPHFNEQRMGRGLAHQLPKESVQTMISQRPKGSFASRLTAACALGLLAATSGQAEPMKQPIQVLDALPIPAPVDHEFAGIIEVNVDATDVARKLFVVRERIPVQLADAMTLLYPRWESASHGPSLTVTPLAGLAVETDGQPLSWRRHPIEPHAFHLDVPPDARTIELRYQIVADADAMSPDTIILHWQRLILYPAGWYARNLPIAATITLPAGLQPATALDITATQTDKISLATVSLETLLDSPVYAARHLKRVALSSADKAPVTLDLMASREDDLALPPEQIDLFRRMVEQTMAVFGAPPFRRYEILALMSEDGSTGGTEHRSSSEISLPSNYFRDWSAQLNNRDIVPHELVHAWNGLYRTPADLWTPTPNVPQGGSLLWVYEGQTEFWGRILAARAGLRSREETLDQLAMDAAVVANRPGRAWRSLSDDVNYPAFMLRQPVPWPDWQRRKDYYQEGVMLWLAVDALLREHSAGRKGIDDFARRFFAGATEDAPTRTYTFEALCAALNAVVPHDWASELRRWVDGHEELDTTSGLERHGWRLVYTDTPTATFRQNEDDYGVLDLSYSIGLTVTDSGVIRTVAWGGPAFEAGIAPRSKIVAVQRQPFTKDRLMEAVRTARRSPVQLTIEQDGRRVERTIPYQATLRYPRLTRIAGKPDTLTRLLQPQ
jgi:predicted metalloprotease with PDZ domain